MAEAERHYSWFPAETENSKGQINTVYGKKLSPEELETRLEVWDHYKLWIFHQPKDNAALFVVPAEKLKEDKDTVRIFIQGVLKQFLILYPTVGLRIGKDGSGGSLTKEFDGILKRMIKKFNSIIVQQIAKKDQFMLNNARGKSLGQETQAALSEKKASLKSLDASADEQRSAAASYLATAKKACLGQSKDLAMMIGGLVGSSVLGFIIYLIVND